MSFSSLTAPVCTVSGTTVTLVATGICTIRAAQAGNANFNPAPNVDQSFTVSPAVAGGFTNGGFEVPNLGGGFQYAPAGATWVFTGAGISGNGSGFTSGNPPAPEGVQVAFLQGSGSQVAQSANIAAGTYTLSIRAAQRGNFQSGTQVLQVLVDGVPVGQFQPPSTAYTNYQTPAFTIATTGSHTLSLAGIGAGSDFTAFVDDVRLTSTAAGGFTNGGFEVPNLGGGFQYAPAGATWVFTGAGISGNGSGFTSGNPPAPEGVQVAFLQGSGSQVAQSASIAAGTYTLSIRAAQRGNYQSGTQVLQVQVDGVPVGQYQPPSTAYTNYQTPAFTIATTGNHTLSLAGIGTGSDFTAFVDDVRLTSTVVVTHALSGTVTTGGSPLGGVSFAAPGSTCTASDSQGHYSCTVPQNWSGAVTPSLSGYTFTPASRSYSSVTANQTAQDYTASATVGGPTPWNTFGRDAQHTALSTTASQPLNQVHWQTPMDLQPQYSGNLASDSLRLAAGHIREYGDRSRENRCHRWVPGRRARRHRWRVEVEHDHRLHPSTGTAGFRLSVRH